MGRYMITVGAVMTDAFISGLTWVGQVSPMALGMTLLTSGFGVLLAANTIADGIFNSADDPSA